MVEIDSTRTTQAPFTRATNPLSHSHPEDTMRAVSGVLEFLEHAILSDMEQDAVVFDMTSGLLSIINVCKSALSAHVSVEGGAA